MVRWIRLNSSGGVRRLRSAGFATRQAGESAGLWRGVRRIPGRPGRRGGRLLCRQHQPSGYARQPRPDCATEPIRRPCSTVSSRHPHQCWPRSSTGRALKCTTAASGGYADAMPGEPRHTFRKPPTADRRRFHCRRERRWCWPPTHWPPTHWPPTCSRCRAFTPTTGGPADSEQLLDELLAGFSAHREATGAMVVLYRLPPGPLDLIVPPKPEASRSSAGEHGPGSA